MGKIFVNPAAVGDATIEITEPGDVHHLARVLRVKCGDSLEISDGVKWEYVTRIEEIEKDRILCRIEDRQAHAREPKTKVTLYQGFPKATKLDSIIQKCVELGVEKIVPVYMDRSVVTDTGKGEKKAGRWQKIADEAAVQCRRGKQPVIAIPAKINEIFNSIVKHKFIILPYENEEGRTIKDALSEIKKNHPGDVEAGADIALIIGPEGGFSDNEVERFKEAGAEVVTLGKTILRTETAGPAALSMIMYELEL
ncbi:MAG: 16S rRNA (uracil(1498)-N(3))-methyltransferase [Firmicutes bacterium]|nr:16S rRNA (uracil(1498)-N(3))-methyltransferase [Bacillota bacterium]